MLYYTYLLLTLIGLPKVRTHAIPNNEIFIDSDVKLIANASGFGMEHFTYEWVHNDKIIKRINVSNTLNIMSVKEDDGGIYRCIVENEYGDKAESNNITLEVISKLCSLQCCS